MTLVVVATGVPGVASTPRGAAGRASERRGATRRPPARRRGVETSWRYVPRANGGVLGRADAAQLLRRVDTKAKPSVGIVQPPQPVPHRQ